MLKGAFVAGALATTAPILTRSSLLAAAQSMPTTAESGEERGLLVSVTPLAEPDAEQIAAQLEIIGLDTSRVRSGVTASRIVYRTPDPAGRPTTASALVVFPRSAAKELRLVTYLHGTTVYRGEAASVNEESPERLIAFALAAAGYAVVAPNYLGLGVGPGFHPYDHVPSTVTAAVDALRAGRALAEQENRRLDERVLVTGFSQGGPATMALGRALQEGVDPALGLGALAPISGPYDFSGTFRAALAGEIAAAPQYLAYLIVAWNRLHHLYDAPSEAFLAPYDAVVEDLLDNDHTPDEVFAGIPVATPQELFTTRFLERLRAPTGALREALLVADGTCDWSPRVPVDLYAAADDRDVPIANASHAERVLRARGADVRLVDVGDVDHTTSAVLAVPRMLARFDALAGQG